MATSLMDSLATFRDQLIGIVDLNFTDGGDPELDLEYPSFTKPGDTSQGMSFISTSYVGLGPWGLTGEVEQFHKDQHQFGRKRTSTWVKWSNGFMVTQDAMFYMMRNKRVREDQVKSLEEKNAQLKQGYGWIKDLIACYFQTRARTSTSDGIWRGTGSDGLVLASTVHKTIKSPQQTVNNAQAAQPLTMMAMQETVAMHMNMKGDEGRPGKAPKAVDWQISRYNMRKIISPLYSEKMPGTANNDPNTLTSGGKSEYKVKYNYNVNRYLDSADTSWLSTTKDHRLYFFEPTEQILFVTEKDTGTQAMIASAWNWCGIDWHSFRGAVQCAGA